MLMLSRAAGETLLIGDSVLGVHQVGPPARLILIEDGSAKAFEFSQRQIESAPIIPLKGARVVVQRIHEGRLVLAIDAPRDVPVRRSELVGKDMPNR